MRKPCVFALIVCVTLLFKPCIVLSQTQQQGVAIYKQAQELEQKARSKEDWQVILGKYEEAFRIFERGGNTRDSGAALCQIANIYTNMGQFQKALDYYEKSLPLVKKAGYTRGETTAFNGMGLAYKGLSQYQKALEYYEKALPIRHKIGDDRGAASSLSNIGSVYSNLGQYQKALDHYEKALSIFVKLGLIEGEALALNDFGVVYAKLGQYQKALDYNEKALRISSKIGDDRRTANSLNNIGAVYLYLGQYQKALEYFDKSLPISHKISYIGLEASTLNNIGKVYRLLGEYKKALEHYEKSRSLSQKVGQVDVEATTLRNIGEVHLEMGEVDKALEKYQSALEINTRIGVPTAEINDYIGNLHIHNGEIDRAEPYIRKAGYDSSFARFYLLKSDYPQAKVYYEKTLAESEKNQNANNLFTAYTGLGKVHEALEDYKKSEEYYQKGMALTEEIRSGLLPSERKNFFEVKINGFYRSEPAKGLTRVRMKLNQASESIDSSEVTRARGFADVISSRSESGVSGVSREVLASEDAKVSKVAALKKELSKIDKEKQASIYENLKGEIHSAELDLNAFVENLWAKYPAYAAVKYPRPVTLKQSKLEPEEYVVVFDVSAEGVGVKLIKGKEIAQTFYTKWKLEELENDVKKFRQPFEQLKLRDYDPSLGNALYKKLLLSVLAHVPDGAPIIIIPDGILATLPFEALVVSGKPIWQNLGKDWPDAIKDYPEGLAFLADEHPISYYQSITALTLARNAEARNKQTQKLLVLADPVFDLSDNRAQTATQPKVSEQDKTSNIALMQTIEDAAQGTFKLKRLAETTELAENLQKMYGANCSIHTGLKANKSDFLTKVAPTLDQYSGIIFATHGVMSTHIPGLMEPFLALTMAPPGTDGFLKMSDVLGLKMNADVVALTACQTGLGKELSGEGVMSMGRAFQYAGAKSVLMSLWSVSESASVLLTENFFQHLKNGKNKLEALKAARDDIRNAGYKHPFFWSAFILVGETS